MYLLEIDMKQKEWTDIPPDVHEAIRHARWWLLRVAERLSDDAYADEGNRSGLAMDCDFQADLLDELLDSYGLPSRYSPPWFDDPETEAETIERKLLERRKKR